MGEDRDFPRAGGPPGDGLRLGSFWVAKEARENRGLPAGGRWEWCQTKPGSLFSCRGGFSVQDCRRERGGVWQGFQKGRGSSKRSLRLGIFLGGGGRDGEGVVMGREPGQAV